MFIQFLIFGLIDGAMIMLAALSFDIVYSTTRIFNIAQGAVYALCSYYLLSFYVDINLSLTLSILLALFLTMTTGLLIEWLFYRPLEKKNSSDNVFIITSLGLYTIIINLIALFYGNETKVILKGVQNSFSFNGLIITEIQFFQFLVPFALVLFYALSRKYTRTGLLLRALSDNKSLLEVVGIDIGRLRLYVFAVSSLLIGAASMLTSLDVGMDPYVGMNIILNAFVAIVIGGKNNMPGIIAGSFVLGLTQSIIIYFYPAKWEPLVTFGLLILVLLFKPEGLFVNKKRAEEL